MRAERHRDGPGLFIADDLPSIDPNHGILHGLLLFIQHRDQHAARARLLEHLKLPHADQCATAPSAANQLDHPRPAFVLQRWKCQSFARPLERPGIDDLRALAVRHEPVEVHVRVQLPLLCLEKIERVDLVNLHEQLRRVFQDDIELHIVARHRELGIRRGKLDIHALLQLLKFRRRKQRRPLLGIPDSIRNHRLGEDGLQPRIAHPIDILLPLRLRALFCEKRQEIFPHERFVIPDRTLRNQRLAEPRIEVHSAFPLQLSGEPLLIHVAHLTRQFQVVQKPRGVIHTLLPIVVQTPIKHARL